MSTITEHNNEISETNGMSETGNELLTIDWQKSGQGIVIFDLKFYTIKRTEFLIKLLIHLICRKEEKGNCRYGRNISRC